MASMAEEGAVIACHDVDTWIRHFQTCKDSKKLAYSIPFMYGCMDSQVVVDFTASWCGPCRAIAPIFADLAKKFTEVVFLKVDVDELKTVSEEFKIEAMPTFIFFKEGSVVDTIVGARKDDLPRKIMTHM